MIEGRQKVTSLMRFAVITPELVENVRRDAKIEGGLAWSHTLLASRIEAKPEHAGVDDQIHRTPRQARRYWTAIGQGEV